MKKFKMALVGLGAVVVVSGMAFGNSYLAEVEETVEDRFRILEEELQVMEAKEQEFFDEEEAKADIAAQNLVQLKEMKTQAANKVKVLDTQAKKSLLSKEMKDLLAQYKNQVKALDEQIAEEQKVVDDWARLKNVRAMSIIK